MIAGLQRFAEPIFVKKTFRINPKRLTIPLFGNSRKGQTSIIPVLIKTLSPGLRMKRTRRHKQKSVEFIIT
jgi:hypothetical protein